MIFPEDPPGFIVCTEIEKAATTNGFRIKKGIEPGGWILYSSTTAKVKVWLAGIPPDGPWFFSLNNSSVASEISKLANEDGKGPGIRTYQVQNLTSLHKAMGRIYALGTSLPDIPLLEYKDKTSKLPRVTESERMVIQRVGQNIFRDALIKYWSGCCAVTGLDLVELLKASHIKPWAKCETDAERLDVYNGILLSPNLDTLFDQGYITFEDTGEMVFCDKISIEARSQLGIGSLTSLRQVSEHHQEYLAWHRMEIYLGKAMI